MKGFFPISLIAFFLASCGVVQRHPDSGYGGYGGRSNYAGPEHNYNSIMETSGFEDISSLSSRDRQALNDRLTLHQLEKGTLSIDERALYYRYKDKMASDEERVAFLKLPTLAAKELWLQRRGYSAADMAGSRNLASIIAESDIAVGMPMSAVTESWGEPRIEEFAGNPRLGNAIWTYTKYVKGADEHKREDRKVYFQGGRVVGWETD
jgi:hypothetical protein